MAKKNIYIKFNMKIKREEGSLSMSNVNQLQITCFLYYTTLITQRGGVPSVTTKQNSLDSVE